MKYPEEKTFELKKDFQKVPLLFRVYDKGDCRCGHDTVSKCWKFIPSKTSLN